MVVMAAIKSIQAIAKKWRDVTPQRSSEYEEGVQSPRRKWADATAAAAESYKAGVTEAISQDRFSKGVRSAGDDKWREGVLTKGTQRWGPGVQLGEEAFQKGFAPYQAAIAKLTLPPRFPRRDPRNLQRVASVAKALGDVKMQQGRGG